MKRFIIILCILITISGAAFWSVSLPHNRSDIKAENGVLDLSEFDFSDMLFSLDGEWEFYYDKQYTPDDFLAAQPEGKTLINTPESWDTQGYPLTGVATYRLNMITTEPSLMLFVPEIFDASIIWINGEQVFTAGTIGASGKETSVSIRNAFVPFSPENGNVEIVIQVGNYEWNEAGLNHSFSVGRPDLLMGQELLKRIILALFFGAVLTVCVYHFVLYFLHRKDHVYLLFAIVCLLLFARFFLETNGFAQLFFPNGVTAFLTSLYMSLIPMHVASLVFFTHASFQLPLGSKLRRVVYGVTLGIPIVLPFILPFSVTGYVYIYLCLIPMVMVVIAAMRKRLEWKSTYSGLYLVALVIFIIWGPLTKSFLGDALFMPGIASNLFLILVQSLMLSQSHAETIRREVELTEKNRLLDGLNQMKTEYVANMSHELKTPLTVISTAVQYTVARLKTSDTDSEEYITALEGVQSEIMRMARLSDVTLQFAATQEGQSEMQPLEMTALLQNIAETYRMLIERRGNSLSLVVPDDLLFIYGNPDMLTQVLINLITNANRHTKNGKIEISAQKQGGKVLVMVHDNGEGIEEALLPDVFERRRKSADGGEGLGLSICRDMIKAHGGTIEIKSELTVGTMVYILLPHYEQGGKQVE